MRNDEMENSGNMPDEFDRTMGSIDGLPEVVSTRMANVRVLKPLGTAGTHSFSVQTYRQKDHGDVIFLERVSASGVTRLVIPPQVADLIARQRDQLTGKTRSRAAKANAQARKERGELPAFMKAKKKTAAKK